MAHIGVRILSREICRLKAEIRLARGDSIRLPACASMLKGRVMLYRRRVRDYAKLIRDILQTLPETT